MRAAKTPEGRGELYKRNDIEFSDDGGGETTSLYFFFPSSFSLTFIRFYLTHIAEYRSKEHCPLSIDSIVYFIQITRCQCANTANFFMIGHRRPPLSTDIKESKTKRMVKWKWEREIKMRDIIFFTYFYFIFIDRLFPFALFNC